MTGRAVVIQADAQKLPISDQSIDLIITSPPYWSLRSYQDGGRHYPGQIGSEGTSHEWLEAMWECTAEWCRVLKPEGSLFVNLGDKYSGAQAQNYNGISNRSTGSADFWRRTDPKRTGIPNKSLMGLPWRYAIGCIDQLGLILRAEIVWAKPNGLPESVTDRVRHSHEQWFHLTKQPRYFSAVDEIREPHYDQAGSPSRFGNTGVLGGNKGGNRIAPDQTTRTGFALASGGRIYNPLGKLPGSVWTIPTEPLTVPDHLGVDHFAAFPLEWPLRIIRGWSPTGICVECGFRDQDRQPNREPRTTREDRARQDAEAVPVPSLRWTHPDLRNSQSCPACGSDQLRPSLILDPFGGTGTSALAAKALGRIGISVDLSHDYSRLAQWRTTDRGELAKAMRVDKPPTQTDGQEALF